MYAITLLILAVSLLTVNASWEQRTCNGGSECAVRFSEMYFDGPVLHATITNQGDTQIKGGTLEMKTQGHGCIFIICQWANGPTLLDPTCSWPGFCSPANPDVLLTPREKKDIQMDFTEALDEASQTTGCCTVERNCGCNLRGTATFTHPETQQYSVVYMEFNCNLNTYVCSV